MWRSPPRATIVRDASLLMEAPKLAHRCAGMGADVASSRAVSARTLAAYRKTRYEIRGIKVMIGRRSWAMDRLLLSYGVREAVFISAYNPFSRVMPPGWNRRMQSRLAESVRRRPNLPAKGSWRRWSEAHLLVFGDARPSRRLLRRYRQNAVVIVRLGQPARLLIPFVVA
jgi:hypothetical protein